MRSFLMAGLLLVLLAPSAQADTRKNIRDGKFLLGFNVGGGFAWAGDDLKEATGAEGDKWGFAGNVRMLGSLGPDFFLGVELGLWTSELSTDVDYTTYVVGPTLSYFAKGGAFARATVGLGRMQWTIPAGGATSTSVKGGGLGVLAAVGYEWRMTESFALGGQVDFGYVNAGQIDEITNITGERFNSTASWFNFTVGFNFYL